MAPTARAWIQTWAHGFVCRRSNHFIMRGGEGKGGADGFVCITLIANDYDYDEYD